MSPERKRASIVSVLLFLGLGHVRWAELKERREKANIPLIELLPVASMDCEKAAGIETVHRIRSAAARLHR